MPEGYVLLFKRFIKLYIQLQNNLNILKKRHIIKLLNIVELNVYETIYCCFRERTREEYHSVFIGGCFGIYPKEASAKFVIE